MEWREEGILIGVRRYGENSVIVEIFFENRGRHLGVVRGGSSRRLNPILQLGNDLDAHWKARLEEHLGSFSVDLVKSRASSIMMDRFALSGLSSICSLLNFTLPERENHVKLFENTRNLLNLLTSKTDWLLNYLHWEMVLLEELGFGLDLSQCAVMGSTNNLNYISPKSGSAVSMEGAGDWSKRLLPLPRSLLGFDENIEDKIQGLNVTGYFLENKVAPALGNRKIPAARGRFIELLKKI
jgi:DNA repair protein RecO (recombination protein O)